MKFVSENKSNSPNDSLIEMMDSERGVFNASGRVNGKNEKDKQSKQKRKKKKLNSVDATTEDELGVFEIGGHSESENSVTSASDTETDYKDSSSVKKRPLADNGLKIKKKSNLTKNSVDLKKRKKSKSKTLGNSEELGAKRFVTGKKTKNGGTTAHSETVKTSRSKDRHGHVGAESVHSRANAIGETLFSDISSISDSSIYQHSNMRVDGTKLREMRISKDVSNNTVTVDSKAERKSSSLGLMQPPRAKHKKRKHSGEDNFDYLVPTTSKPKKRKITSTDNEISPYKQSKNKEDSAAKRKVTGWLLINDSSSDVNKPLKTLITSTPYDTDIYRNVDVNNKKRRTQALLSSFSPNRDFKATIANTSTVSQSSSTGTLVSFFKQLPKSPNIHKKNKGNVSSVKKQEDTDSNKCSKKPKSKYQDHDPKLNLFLDELNTEKSSDFSYPRSSARDHQHKDLLNHYETDEPDSPLNTPLLEMDGDVQTRKMVATQVKIQNNTARAKSPKKQHKSSILDNLSEHLNKKEQVENVGAVAEKYQAADVVTPKSPKKKKKKGDRLHVNGLATECCSDVLLSDTHATMSRITKETTLVQSYPETENLGKHIKNSTELTASDELNKKVALEDEIIEIPIKIKKKKSKLHPEQAPIKHKELQETYQSQNNENSRKSNIEPSDLTSPEVSKNKKKRKVHEIKTFPDNECNILPSSTEPRKVPERNIRTLQQTGTCDVTADSHASKLELQSCTSPVVSQKSSKKAKKNRRETNKDITNIESDLIETNQIGVSSVIDDSKFSLTCTNIQKRKLFTEKDTEIPEIEPIIAITSDTEIHTTSEHDNGLSRSKEKSKKKSKKTKEQNESTLVPSVTTEKTLNSTKKVFTEKTRELSQVELAIQKTSDEGNVAGQKNYSDLSRPKEKSKKKIKVENKSDTSLIIDNLFNSRKKALVNVKSHESPQLETTIVESRDTENVTAQKKYIDLGTSEEKVKKKRKKIEEQNESALDTTTIIEKLLTSKKKALIDKTPHKSSQLKSKIEELSDVENVAGQENHSDFTTSKDKAKNNRKKNEQNESALDKSTITEKLLNSKKKALIDKTPQVEIKIEESSDVENVSVKEKYNDFISRLREKAKKTQKAIEEQNESMLDKSTVTEKILNSKKKAFKENTYKSWQLELITDKTFDEENVAGQENYSDFGKPKNQPKKKSKAENKNDTSTIIEDLLNSKKKALLDKSPQVTINIEESSNVENVTAQEKYVDLGTSKEKVKKKKKKIEEQNESALDTSTIIDSTKNALLDKTPHKSPRLKIQIEDSSDVENVSQLGSTIDELSDVENVAAQENYIDLGTSKKKSKENSKKNQDKSTFFTSTMLRKLLISKKKGMMEKLHESPQLETTIDTQLERTTDKSSDEENVSGQKKHYCEEKSKKERKSGNKSDSSTIIENLLNSKKKTLRIKLMPDKRPKRNIELNSEDGCEHEEQNLTIEDFEDELTHEEYYTTYDAYLKRFGENFTIIEDFPVPDEHAIEPTVAWKHLLPELREEFKSLGMYLEFRKFTPEEDELILKNWRAFCKIYNFKEYEYFYFTRCTFKTKHVLHPDEYLRFARFLGQGLPKRFLKSIMIRFKRLHKYRTVKTGRWDSEEDAALLKYIDDQHLSYIQASYKLKRTQVSAMDRYDLLTGKHSHTVKLTAIICDGVVLEEQIKLIMSFHKIKTVSELRALPVTHPMKWCKINKINRIKNHAARKLWYLYLYTALHIDQAHNLLEIGLQIYDCIEKQQHVSHKRNIDWWEMSNHIPGFHPYHLNRIFYTFWNSAGLFTNRVDDWRDGLQVYVRYIESRLHKPNCPKFEPLHINEIGRVLTVPTQMRFLK